MTSAPTSAKTLTANEIASMLGGELCGASDQKFGQVQDVAADWQTGFIHWQAFLGIISTSTIFAIFGAKLASNLPVKVLKQLFSLVLLVGAIYLMMN